MTPSVVNSSTLAILRCDDAHPMQRLASAVVLQAMADARYGAHAAEARQWLTEAGQHWLALVSDRHDTTALLGDWLERQPWYRQKRAGRPVRTLDVVK